MDALLDGNRLAGAVLWRGYGVWLAAGFGAYARIFHEARRRGWSVAVAGVPPLLVIERLQPQLFPVNAGTRLVYAPATIQTADLGGPLLLTALVAVANVAVFETWTWWRGGRPRPLAVWLTTLTIVLAALGYGAFRSATIATSLERAPGLRVGVVQANLGVLEKRTQSLLTHNRHLEETRALLAGVVPTRREARRRDRDPRAAARRVAHRDADLLRGGPAGFRPAHGVAVATEPARQPGERRLVRRLP